MMQDAQLHRFTTLIAWKNDRISRNRRDALNYKDQLKKCGVQICYAEMDIPKGPEGILMESLMDGLAEYYSAELSQKIRRGMTESAYKCHALGSYPPFGLMVREKEIRSRPPDGPLRALDLRAVRPGHPDQDHLRCTERQGPAHPPGRRV